MSSHRVVVTGAGVISALGPDCEAFEESLFAGRPAIRLLTRFLTIPAASGRRLKELIRYEARHQIPFALEEVHWDCALLQMPDDSTQGPHEAMLLACKSQDVEQHLAIFKRTGIQVTGLQSDTVALHNYFRYEAGEGDSSGSKPQAASTIIDIGHDTTNLVFSSTTRCEPVFDPAAIRHICNG